MNRYLRVRLPLLALAFMSLAVLAADTNIDSARSTLIATFKQEGVPVDAPFRKFNGRIVYDAKNVAAASATLDVETGSLDIGDESYSAEVRKPAWFDSVKFPMATFRSTVIKAVSATRFDATGTLSIKGRAVTITVPVAVQASGSAFDGTLVISRKAFGIGSADWDDVLDDKVTVRFHLVSPGH